MPDINTHCSFSFKRTGDEFRDLHTWMDSKFLRFCFKEKHRAFRHSDRYIPEVIKKFGKDAVPEFLMHISADYKSSARKWGLKQF